MHHVAIGALLTRHPIGKVRTNFGLPALSTALGSGLRFGPGLLPCQKPRLRQPGKDEWLSTLVLQRDRYSLLGALPKPTLHCWLQTRVQTGALSLPFINEACSLSTRTSFSSLLLPNTKCLPLIINSRGVVEDFNRFPKNTVYIRVRLQAADATPSAESKELLSNGLSLPVASKGADIFKLFMKLRRPRPCIAPVVGKRGPN